jgi:hypothetical protein
MSTNLLLWQSKLECLSLAISLSWGSSIQSCFAQTQLEYFQWENTLAYQGWYSQNNSRSYYNRCFGRCEHDILAEIFVRNAPCLRKIVKIIWGIYVMDCFTSSQVEWHGNRLGCLCKATKKSFLTVLDLQNVFRIFFEDFNRRTRDKLGHVIVVALVPGPNVINLFTPIVYKCL